MGKSKGPEPPEGYRYVYCSWRLCPQTGEKLYAKAYGYKAWRILVPIDKE